MTGVVGREGDRASELELERLGDELSRLGMELGCRDITVTLGPPHEGEGDGGQVLEVLNRRLVGNGKPAGAVTRVWRQAGRFWWEAGEENLGSEEGIRQAADRIAAALQWSRQALNLPAPQPEPGSP